MLVDLTPSEDQILDRMKSKTRYNIHLADRKGITVRSGSQDDLSMLYKMYAYTSVRAGFTIRDENYYQALWRSFMKAGLNPDRDPGAQALIAEFEGQPVSGAVIFRIGKKAWYLHGMSLPEHSEKMAPYLIQWEAILWAKRNGCEVYDMWGAPEVFNQSDSLWGVYRFKRGFGGNVSRTIGAWDYPARPFLYTLYTVLLPKVLAGMRWFGNRRIKQIVTQEE